MTQEPLSVSTPALPKGGGAIQSIGKGWGAVGSSGAASCSLALPISAGRGYAPSLGLSYSSASGNGLFGLGWAASVPRIARRTTKGVPAYTHDDVIVGPSGDVWMPELDSQGKIVFTEVSEYRKEPVGSTYQVTRYFPRAEGAFERIEYWSHPSHSGFWLIHGADGSLAVYGKSKSARTAHPDDEFKVAEWLLEETLNVRGEHVLYEYKPEDHANFDKNSPRNYKAQSYLSRVRYGNFIAHDNLYVWNEEKLNALKWHFDLVFDYGERSTTLTEKPTYEEPANHSWPVRSDPHSSFTYGFELGNLRLCHQVLMFHYFPEEPALGPTPQLVQRLLLEYETGELSYTHLTAAHFMAYDAKGEPEYRPPVEFSYAAFTLGEQRYTPFDAMPGLNDGQQYQLLDLYGEGLPGVLYRNDKNWLYREPVRAELVSDPDQVSYGAWHALPVIPVADANKPVRQSLTDLTGDGRLDWIVAQPGLSGFFTLNPDRSWSRFATFSAFPQEFFSPQGQMADLIGAGLSDLALIGTRSVRLYANQREHGFANALEVPHNAPKNASENDDALPILSDSRSELVAFSDVLGSGQQHLIRIRHNEIRCWPNLGRGNFGKGFKLADLPFDYAEFDASRILLADLDGSGAADLMYLTADAIEIYMNRCGNGFADKQTLPWPIGVRYDRFCQVSTADLQGLGCSSLILTVPHRSPRHWRCDFVHAKPYLLSETNNNMGAVGTVSYRSSAQEWLDEKRELSTHQPAVSYLPFPMHVVKQQTQFDEITGSRLTQHFQYRQGFYDGFERETRGFGLLIQTDTEDTSGFDAGSGNTPPVQTKTWFHTGRLTDYPARGQDTRDSAAKGLGATLLTRCEPDTTSACKDRVIVKPTDAQQRELARALSGSTVRVEVLGPLAADNTRPLYSVQHNRFMVRELIPQASDKGQLYASMQVLPLESISYQYDRFYDDPLCAHSIGLRWDCFGNSTHAVSINYPRRKNSTHPGPFEEEHQNTWWLASHDEAQQFYYVNESLAEAIHLTDAQGWQLGLPYRARSNALVLPTCALPSPLISYEYLIDDIEGPLKPRSERELTGLSVQRYTDRTNTLADGIAHFPALMDAVETAELDAVALSAYDRVMQPDELEARLLEIGYQRMSVFMPPDNAVVLWSVKRGFAQYEDLDKFYTIKTFRPTLSQGTTSVSYDPYCLTPVSVRAPDGCTTVAVHDYRTLQPWKIIDPNQNTQEALFDAFGQLRATSFYGTERGEPVGFDPVSGFLASSKDPAAAIQSPEIALGRVASASFYDPFSWMGRVPQAFQDNPDLMQQHIAAGDIMPTGHLRAKGRRRTSINGWAGVVDNISREPVYSAVLLADRYPDDAERQIRISLACFDGFGRTLQSKQKVEPGIAYHVDEAGNLETADGQPIQAPSPQRWRVSERVEYNNKGLAIRVYRPYFASEFRYINDESFRRFGYSDQQFYDPLGRPTLTVTAKGYWRRQTYLTWYTISEDENDLHQEALETLKAPIVLEAGGNQLDPLKALQGVTVRVEYLDMQPGDNLTLTWQGVAGAGTTSRTTTLETAPERVLFEIPATVVAANIGKTVTLNYTVTRSTGNKTSACLTLQVAELPPALLGSLLHVEKDDNGTIYLKWSQNGSYIDIKTWPLVAVGQKVWLLLEGQKADGSPHNIRLWAGASVNSNEIRQGYLRKLASYSYLKELAENSTLKIIFKVAFSGKDEAQAMTFPIKTLRVMTNKG
ncbi:SpvB/TcaC N-terminal domain-containing protein [Pseudomonas sp.]|uniref:SpvB/TcaC N-terminal domain-containing protein n=1 Tax=Pseudomonas sp. TaxID=306 RepID=UPI00263A18A5|nr:SpvB/TcaC N-terminal domain-containing protein [Pseudomonas sp.]